VICFSFGKGQTGGGQTLRHAGEPFQRECRGSGDGAAGADRRAEGGLRPAGAEGPGSQPGVSAHAEYEPGTIAAHQAPLSGGQDGQSEGQGL